MSTCIIFPRHVKVSMSYLIDRRPGLLDYKSISVYHEFIKKYIKTRQHTCHPSIFSLLKFIDACHDKTWNLEVFGSIMLSSSWFIFSSHSV